MEVIKVASMILNKPMLPNRVYPSRNIALERVEWQGKEGTFLELKLLSPYLGFPCTIMTPRNTIDSVKSYLEKNNYFDYDFNESPIYLFEEEKTRCFHPATGDFFGFSDEGSFSAITQLFNTGLILKYIESGIDYLHISFVENLSTKFYFRIPYFRRIFSKEPDLLVELAHKIPEESEPLAVETQDRRRFLFEREEIDNEKYIELKSNPNITIWSVTNTYWVRISGLMKEIGATKESIESNIGTGYFGLVFDRYAPPLNVKKSLMVDGAMEEVICPETRLSRLTHFLNTDSYTIGKERYNTFFDISF
jgi:hypothetical protein